MNIEDTKKCNDISREVLANLEKSVELLSEACSVSLKNKAFGRAHGFMRKAEMCDGLRAEVHSGITEEKRTLPTPVVATGHEQKELKS